METLFIAILFILTLFESIGLSFYTPPNNFISPIQCKKCR